MTTSAFGWRYARSVKLIARTTVPILCGLFLSQQQLFAAAPTEGGERGKAQAFVERLESKATPKKERLESLHKLYRAKETLSKEERLEFWRAVKGVASDKTADAQLRAGTIWVLGNLGMMFKHEKTLPHQEVAQQCRFLLEAAADEAESLRVRRISIITLGNLKMTEAVPVMKTLLANKANHNRPEIGRSVCVSLAELSVEEAIQPVGEVLGGTTNSAVFGSAAYALGRTKSMKALPFLVVNRSRLGDNLSVDNAVQELCPAILEALKTPSDSAITDAIKATRSLWREEQKAEFRPLLERVLADNANPVETRRAALHRLIDDAYLLPIPAAQKRLAVVMPLVEKEPAFNEERARIQQILNAKPAKPMEVRP